MTGTPSEALARLAAGNDAFRAGHAASGDISLRRVAQTAAEGQSPFAAVLTCADSRVPPEHIFGAGIGDLYVVRTAGNTAAGLNLASLEFAAVELAVPLIVVMGHSHCAAVAAARLGSASGEFTKVTDRIFIGLGANQTEDEAVLANARASRQDLLENWAIKHRVAAGHLTVALAIYDTATGQVVFWDD